MSASLSCRKAVLQQGEHVRHSGLEVRHPIAHVVFTRAANLGLERIRGIISRHYPPIPQAREVLLRVFPVLPVLFRPAKPEIHAAGMTNVAVWISVLCRMQPSLPSPRSLLVPGAAVRAAALLHHHAAGLSVSRMAAPGTRHQTKLQVKCTCSLVWYCTVYCT